MPDNKGAYFEPEENCIYVRKGMDAQEIFKVLYRNWYLQDMQKIILTMTGVKMHSTHIVRRICCLKSMEWILANLILLMHQSFFENMEPQEVRGELSKARDAANTISGRMTRVLEQDKKSESASAGKRARLNRRNLKIKTGEQKTQEHDRGEAR